MIKTLTALRVVFPAFFILFVLFIVVFQNLLSAHNAEVSAVEAAVSALKDDLARAQGVIAFELKHADIDFIRRYISSFSLHDYRKKVILHDAEGTVVAANLFSLIGNSMPRNEMTQDGLLNGETPPDYDALRISFEETSGILSGVTKFCVISSADSSELCYRFLMEDDLNPLLSAIERQHFDELTINLIVASVLFLLGLWAIQRRVINPLSEIGKSLELFSTGDNTPKRVKETGFREIKNFIRSTNDLIERLQSTRAREDQSSRRFENIFQRSSDGIIVTDRSGVIKNANSKAYEIFGYKDGEIIEQNIEILVPDDHASRHQSYVDTYMETGQSRIIGRGREVFGKRKDGLLIPLFVGVASYEENGNSVFLANISDLTELRDSQAALKESEEKYRLLFELSEDPMWLIDGEIFVLCNNAAAKMLGYNSPDEINEMSPHAISPEYQPDGEKSCEKAPRMISKALENGYHRFEWQHKKIDGQTFPVEVTLTRIPYLGHQALFCVWRDLSEIKDTANRLRQSQKMEAVGQMVGGIAHDFNNLLGIILGNLELMSRKLDPDPRLSRQLERAMSAARRGAGLTRKLLNFSRQMPSDGVDFDVNDSITELSDLLERALTKSISFQLNLQDGLPLVNAEKGDLEDVITNLCINARDAMPTGGTLIIETRFTTVGPDEKSKLAELKPGPYVQITVSDTGTGMPPEVVDKIFEPFYSTKEKGKGTGLGLAMVYGFIKRSGGLITVYTEEGLGTSFNLYLPSAERRQKERLEDKAVKNDVSLLGNEKILIVDDEEALAEVAQTLLSETGYETVVAASGEEAVEILKADDTIDMIFSDVVMPGEIDGFKLVEITKDIRPDIKVCLTSGFTGSLSSKERRNALNCRLLKKPYSNRELLSFIRENLGNN